MDFNTVSINISDDIRDIMEERGINEDDIREVLVYSESDDGAKLVNEDEHYLGKKRINNFTVYAEYIVSDDTVEILDLYSHRVALSEDQEGE